MTTLSQYLVNNGHRFSDDIGCAYSYVRYSPNIVQSIGIIALILTILGQHLANIEHLFSAQDWVTIGIMGEVMGSILDKNLLNLPTLVLYQSRFISNVIYSSFLWFILYI